MGDDGREDQGRAEQHGERPAAYEAPAVVEDGSDENGKKDPRESSWRSFAREFFIRHLHFTPSAYQLDLLERDFCVLSPYLYKAAFKEVAGKHGYFSEDFARIRATTLDVYARKVDEQRRLFPILHILENACRSTLASELEEIFDAEQWWLARSRMLRTDDPNNFTFINKKSISKDFAHIVDRMIRTVDGEELRRSKSLNCANGYEFLELCTLAQIADAITQHWSAISSGRRKFNKALTKSKFTAKMKSINDSRNELYHHRSLAGMNQVALDCDEVLDFLNVRLRFMIDKVTNANAKHLEFQPTMQRRHLFW